MRAQRGNTVRIALKSAVAVVLLSMSATAAGAADLPVEPSLAPQPPPPFASPWTGVYVGGFVGATVARQSLDEHGANQFFALTGAGDGSTLNLPTSDPETPFSLSGNKASFTGGALIGANYQLGIVVFGVEADIAGKTAGTNANQTTGQDARYNFTPFDCVTPTDCDFDTASATRTEVFSANVKQGWDASLRLRLGGLVTPGILVYGTGGVGVGAVNSSFSYSATTVYTYETPLGVLSPPPITHTTSGSGSWSDTRVGWTAGGGAEAVVVGNWKIRAEYRFTDLGRFTKQIPLARTSTDPASLPNTGSLSATANLSAAFHTVRLGIAYGF
jgi:outer membrane immunogenic protein